MRRVWKSGFSRAPQGSSALRSPRNPLESLGIPRNPPENEQGIPRDVYSFKLVCVCVCQPFGSTPVVVSGVHFHLLHADMGDDRQRALEELWFSSGRQAWAVCAEVLSSA